jgi:hypothetical protein
VSETLRWFTSTYGTRSNNECDESAHAWRKSSYSDGDGGECVEVATCPHTIHVRDTKLSDASPIFTVTSASWAAFLDSDLVR